MKLLRHGPRGAEKPGLLDATGRIRDLSGVIDDVAGAALAPDTLARLAAIDPATLPLVAEGTRIGPCVGRVGKFVAIGLNYSEHAAEAGMAIPKEPVVFMKATSCISGPNDDVIAPRDFTKLDWEVELGVVIGTEARYVTKEAALGHVAGYCVVNDVSERAFQAERGGTWDKGKGCDTFGPIGPWLATRDEVPDPQNLRLWLSVDGVMRQDGSTKTMIFPVAELVSYVSQFMSLQPGDVITTGTPSGVGMGVKPEPVFLAVGQTMRLGVEGLGEQTQTVVAPV
ncbi:fumarylacetoacetate hydrolase family protein [Pinisolibacter aquiterrae]|uniref:fumarylacetoacetate hydrolase family protein n=1 Tax=Pinisolibacter aquiterrae TaxID=2815579 RepID=UPI001C3CADF3|nr:fumarylacetoacetate hydrolase family protein [Pinisolibacter aquiterrae]MBV5265581.1 fumarylacetoacetate hydrolase family protein [Pinisolibacter aquiterrae]MCC8236852.1 fumarylacetoacetate hydrolase family protein [Pinisolibacter aquiterrae]